MSATIGLVLGGGGARGLAHIAILEAFDEAGTLTSPLVAERLKSHLAALALEAVPVALAA